MPTRTSEPASARSLRLDCKGYIPANTLPSSLFKGSFTMEMWARHGSWINSTGIITATSRCFTSRDGNIGWILEFVSSSGQNKLRDAQRHHVGRKRPRRVHAAHRRLEPLGGDLHQPNPGNEDSQYSVSIYVTPSTATTPTLIGTFTLNPARTATQLAATALAFNGDFNGSGFGAALGGDMMDGMRLSDIARTSSRPSCPPSGNLPPLTITTLTASDPQLTSVDAQLEHPWDDLDPGNQAVSYELRYSTSPDHHVDLGQRTQVTGLPAPAAPGTAAELHRDRLGPGHHVLLRHSRASTRPA